MSDTGKSLTGLPTAVAGLLSSAVQAGAADPGGAVDQVDMFADVLDDVSLPTRARSGPKGGRPAGSQNATTKRMREYLLARYAHPLIGLAETWSRAPAELAEELELYQRDHLGNVKLNPHTGKPLLRLDEAFKLQQEARATALPYLMSKAPIEVHTSGTQRGVLNMIFGDVNVGAGADQIPFAPIEQNQGFVDVEPAQSDGEKSDDTKTS